VDEETVIIVGHTRYKAALKLGWTEAPVHVAVGLTPAQAKAYRLADNQTATLSSWDDDKLPLELMGLQQMGFDLDLTGFSGDELLRLLGSETNEGQGDSDAIPEPPDEAVTQPGDLWLLGNTMTTPLTPFYLYDGPSLTRFSASGIPRAFAYSRLYATTSCVNILPRAAGRRNPTPAPAGNKQARVRAPLSAQ
jgi:hypothetical protein